MKKLTGCLFLLLLLGTYSVSAQTIGTWKSYLAYTTTTECAEANNLVYAIADGSLFSYSKSDQEVVYYSRENGLNDNQISHIGFNSNVNTLLIIYSNGNIDLLSEDGISNIPYFKTSTSVQDKTVNTIYFYNEYAYLSTNFGIVVVNLKKKEITDTYKLSKSVYDVCIQGNVIYTSTTEGLLKGDISTNLLDVNNWNKVTLNTSVINDKNIKRIHFFNDVLCMLVPGNGVYYLKGDGSISSLLNNNTLTNMTMENGFLIPFSSSVIYLYSSLTVKSNINAGIVKYVSTLKDAATLWIAAGDEGLKAVEKKSADIYEVVVSGITSKGPKRNLSAFLTTYKDKLLVTGGGRWADRFNNPGTVMIYDGQNWVNFDEKKITEQSGISFLDATSIAVDPRDPEHYFVSSWGEGVYEFKVNEFVSLHNQTNSTLSSVYSGTTYDGHYIRVDGLCYDSANNLWMTNSEVKEGIKILKADGTWSKIYYEALNGKLLIDKILITQKGYKWVNLPRVTPGIFVFDDKGTIDDATDDIYNFFSLFTDADGKTIEASAYYCMAEDKNGIIWIGTDKGPIICTVPSRAIENPGTLYCSYIVRPLDDGTSNGYRLLENEKINAIAIDGGNRKWIGTESSGVFLLSEDGMETIAQFTTDNSPILSNTIQSIAINNLSGEVFIGTNKGLVSYMGDAIEGKKDYSEVRAFPNPVRPEYNDKVTVTGLMEQSNVKITDLNSNIIYQATSVGGQLTWNCRNRKGERVASGIYLVLASTADGGESVVTKIMVIK